MPQVLEQSLFLFKEKLLCYITAVQYYLSPEETSLRRLCRRSTLQGAATKGDEKGPFLFSRKKYGGGERKGPSSPSLWLFRLHAWAYAKKKPPPKKTHIFPPERNTPPFFPLFATYVGARADKKERTWRRGYAARMKTCLAHKKGKCWIDKRFLSFPRRSASFFIAASFRATWAIKAISCPSN